MNKISRHLITVFNTLILAPRHKTNSGALTQKEAYQKALISNYDFISEDMRSPLCSIYLLNTLDSYTVCKVYRNSNLNVFS